ncbi:MAG: NFACT RNA binding domain-containing protein [Candidatus Micrarchaeaceae archaeon]
MEFEIDFTKNAQQNASAYYERAKELKKKIEGAQLAIEKLEKSMQEAKHAEAEKPLKVARQKKWYEKFHWFFASDGRLAIGGRNVQQNELLNSRYFEDNDLFFHADVFGASVVIFKGGKAASRQAKEEVAEFAACYSSAWKDQHNAADVYCLERNNVGKSTNSGYVAAGSFVMKGEREWFRGAVLKLVAFMKEGIINVVPELTFERIHESAKNVLIEIGDEKKSDAAKKIAAYFETNELDELLQQLPAGSFHITLR